MSVKAAARSVGCLAMGAALAALLGGCFYQWGGARKTSTPFFEKAVYTISGGEILLRNDDHQAWRNVTVTLQTDQGYFRLRTGDMAPGGTRELSLASFSGNGRHFGPGMRLEDVWVQAHYPDGTQIDEPAYSSSAFGGQPVVPSSAQ